MLALEPLPAYLMGPRADILVWNAGMQRLLGRVSAAPDGQPNLLWWLFTEELSDVTARNTLARFRAEHARRGDRHGVLRVVGAWRSRTGGVVGDSVPLCRRPPTVSRGTPPPPCRCARAD